jgi:hypothetical protein
MARDLDSDRFKDALAAIRANNPLAAAWFKKAYDQGVRGESWFAVKVGTEQDKAWRVYFAKLGWTPYAVNGEGMGKNRSYTMPVEWPTWLPAGFSEGLV